MRTAWSAFFIIIEYINLVDVEDSAVFAALETQCIRNKIQDFEKVAVKESFQG